jgi:hypothetical protein
MKRLQGIFTVRELTSIHSHELAGLNLSTLEKPLFKSLLDLSCMRRTREHCTRLHLLTSNLVRMWQPQSTTKRILQPPDLPILIPLTRTRCNMHQKHCPAAFQTAGYLHLQTQLPALLVCECQDSQRQFGFRLRRGCRT